jgi:hypothetical protein
MFYIILQFHILVKFYSYNIYIIYISKSKVKYKKF